MFFYRFKNRKEKLEVKSISKRTLIKALKVNLSYFFLTFASQELWNTYSNMHAVKAAVCQRLHGETSIIMFLITLLAFTVFEGLKKKKLRLTPQQHSRPVLKCMCLYSHWPHFCSGLLSWITPLLQADSDTSLLPELNLILLPVRLL